MLGNNIIMSQHCSDIVEHFRNYSIHRSVYEKQLTAQSAWHPVQAVKIGQNNRHTYPLGYKRYQN